MKLRYVLSIILLLLSFSNGYSQKVSIETYNKPLNEILIDLHGRYNLQLSFNDRLLSQFRLTINATFDSPDKAIQSLITGLPLTFHRKAEVFVILPEKKKAQFKTFLLAGQILEARSSEALPYSHVYVDDRILVSDMKGSFMYMSTRDSLFHIKVSHLGYYIKDTIVAAGINHRINLLPSRIGLKEILIKDKSPDRSTQIGNKAGAMRFNQQIAKYLPGNSDNSVFTLLRLMPGILAASELSNGLIIWGAYEGQSQILLDGYTIWGLKSFNDDIDVVNPLFAKEIEVFKGGYDVSNGGRVGGLVRISGKTGSTTKPSFNVNINNVLLNGLAEVPLWKNTSVLFSFRKTYFNLYNNKDVKPANNRNIVLPAYNKPNVDYTVFPDYNYQDANFKFSTRNDHGELFNLSLMGGGDLFSYTINKPYNTNTLLKINAENNTQYGASALYGQTWRNGDVSNFTVSTSSLETDLSDIAKLVKEDGTEVLRRDYLTKNRISEFSSRVDNFFKISTSHLLESGLGLEKNTVYLKADSAGYNQTTIRNDVARMNGYLQDHINLTGGLEFKIGLRADFPFNLKKVYFQPRISASIKLTEHSKVNVAVGKYNQFIKKSSVVDDLGNYRYFWTASDNLTVPVLTAIHWVAGYSYLKNNFTFSIESYFRHTDGLTRFIARNQRFKDKISTGEGQSYGVDFFIKKDYKGHSAWISYTLSKTEEKFTYFPKYNYQQSPQDQRHELKVALLLNLKPFNFSANYVFGSGFPLNTGTSANPVYIEPDYNRVDVSVNYRFAIRKIAAETGLSIMNLFDAHNIRYSNFEKVPSDQAATLNIYSEAVPFSPRVSLRLYY